MVRSLFLYMFLALMGCSSSHNAGTPQPENDNFTAKISEPFFCNDLIKADELDDTTNYIPTTITSYRLVENCVCVSYQYSGCRETPAIMLWENNPQESNRPEVMLKLKVQQAGLCEMLLSDSTCFSLKQMQFVGNQVLVFLNNRKNNLALNFNNTPTD